MAKRKNTTKAATPPEALAKAEAPAIHVESKVLLPDYQPELQKSNLNEGKFETMFRAVKRNGWAHRAIEVVAASVVANGWKPQPLDPKAQPNEDAEAALLRFLSQPNEEMSFEDVVSRIVWDLLICGNSYWEVPRVRNNKATKRRVKAALNTVLAKDSEYALIIEDAFDASIQELEGLPLALFHMDPRTVSIQTDEHGRVQSYTQFTKSGKKVILDRSEVMHFRKRGASCDVYGESPLEALELDLTIDLYRQTYIKAMLENSTQLGYLFSFEGAQPDTVARFQEWLNVRARGVVNAGQNIVTEGKMAVEQVPSPPIGKGSNELGDALKEKILCCLGVPVAKLGTADGGSLGGQNQEGSNKSFVENMVKPLARMIERQFNLQLIPDFKVVGVEGYGVAILTEDVDILQIRAETVTGLKNAGILTLNESRVELRQVPYQGEGDVPMVLTSSGLISVKASEASQGSLEAINAKLDALAGLVGGMRQNSANTDADSVPVDEPQSPQSEGQNAGAELQPGASPAKVAKTLGALANELLKVLRDEAE